MKHHLVAFFLLFIYVVAAQKKQLPISIVQTTAQRWVSGAPGGRTGTNYSIKIFIRTAEKIEFKNIWLGKQNIPFSVEFFSTDIPQKIYQGDTLLLTSNIMNNEPQDEEAKRLPVAYKGAALIEATINGKARYFIAKSILRLKDLKTQ